MTRQRTYAMVGQRSGDLLSYGGRVLTHPVREEIEFLVRNVRVVELTRDPGAPLMRLRDHPGLAHIRWPLQRGDFK